MPALILFQFNTFVSYGILGFGPSPTPSRQQLIFSSYNMLNSSWNRNPSLKSMARFLTFQPPLIANILFSSILKSCVYSRIDRRLGTLLYCFRPSLPMFVICWPSSRYSLTILEGSCSSSLSTSSIC